MDATAIAERVREKRTRLKLSQRQLDHKAGLSHGYTSKLELGQVNPTIKMLAKIAAALKSPLDELLGATETGEESRVPEVPPEITEMEMLLQSIYPLNRARVQFLINLAREIKEDEERKYRESLRAKPIRKLARRRPPGPHPSANQKV
jgi:transcriptional regulator with XRE-family HTH domain